MLSLAHNIHLYNVYCICHKYWDFSIISEMDSSDCIWTSLLILEGNLLVNI